MALRVAAAMRAAAALYVRLPAPTLQAIAGLALCLFGGRYTLTNERIGESNQSWSIGWCRACQRRRVPPLRSMRGSQRRRSRRSWGSRSASSAGATLWRMNASVSQNQILSASSGREHRALGSLLGALLCALGGGYGGDDSRSLGVSAVASEVTARHAEPHMARVAAAAAWRRLA